VIVERLNDDLGQPAIRHGAALPWVTSPQPGVERLPLYRVGGEHARATSLVRYAPGSRFTAHSHPGGEEFLVLQGTFEDEHGRYPAGTYVRNPPGSRHAPGSAEGCVIFVRLRQFPEHDRQQVVVPARPADGQPLFESPDEKVWLQAIEPGGHWRQANPRGLEVLVLQGWMTLQEQRLHPLSWLRLPPGMQLSGVAGTRGARLWIKDASPDLGC
jgi:anti-sigma factor ChrR (cupin superfamily)